MLSNSNFRNLLFGRSVSNIGDSFYAIGLSWYVFSLTKSAFWVGVLNFFLFLPNVFSFLLGNYLKRHDKRRMLVNVEVAQGLLLIAILAIITINFDSRTKVLLICVVCAFLISTVGMNAYVVEDVLMPELVSHDKLSKASMYMSFSYNSMDYVGNALGGVLLKILGIIPLLIVDLLSFITSALFFKNMKVVYKNEKQEESLSPFAGVKLIGERADLLLITIVGGSANFLFGGLAVYDVVIGNILGGSSMYGFLLASESIGVTIGSTVMAQVFLRKVNLGKLFWISNFGMAVFLGVTFMATNRFLFLLIWAVAFSFQGLNRVVTTPYLQSTLERENRALFFSAFNTLTVTPLPLGSLIFGKFSGIIDWRIFILIFSVFALISGIVFQLDRKISSFREEDEPEAM